MENNKIRVANLTYIFETSKDIDKFLQLGSIKDLLVSYKLQDLTIEEIKSLQKEQMGRC